MLWFFSTYYTPYYTYSILYLYYIIPTYTILYLYYTYTYTIWSIHLYYTIRSTYTIIPNIHTYSYAPEVPRYLLLSVVAPHTRPKRLLQKLLTAATTHSNHTQAKTNSSNHRPTYLFTSSPQNSSCIANLTRPNTQTDRQTHTDNYINKNHRLLSLPIAHPFPLSPPGYPLRLASLIPPQQLLDTKRTPWSSALSSSSSLPPFDLPNTREKERKSARERAIAFTLHFELISIPTHRTSHTINSLLLICFKCFDTIFDHLLYTFGTFQRQTYTHAREVKLFQYSSIPAIAFNLKPLPDVLAPPEHTPKGTLRHSDYGC